MVLDGVESSCGGGANVLPRVWQNKASSFMIWGCAVSVRVEVI